MGSNPVGLTRGDRITVVYKYLFSYFYIREILLPSVINIGWGSYKKNQLGTSICKAHDHNISS